MAEDTETFNLEASDFNGYNLPIDYIIPRIIDYYIKNTDSRVKEKLAQSCQTARLYEHMSEKIRELNAGVLTNEGILSMGTSSIVIPTAIAFFRTTFPTFHILGCTTERVEVDPDIGILNKLEYVKDLEDMVRSLSNPVNFETLKEESRSVIRAALHNLRIYTAPSIHSPQSPEPNGIHQEIAAAIVVFQEEYMKLKQDEDNRNLFGRINFTTLIGMNCALNNGWHRELSFYYRFKDRDGNIYFPYDMDKQEVFWQHLQYKEIFALEGRQQGINPSGFFLGKVVTYISESKQFFGTQRFARDHLYRLSSTSMERVISAIARNEGGVSGGYGGYDTVNSYDGVFLSVGLFHWNQDWLWRLLREFYEIKPPDDRYKQFLQRLGIDEAEWKDRVRQFKINGKFYKMDKLEVLRRLKYVYRFLREAEKREFREAQDRAASAWVNTALNRNLVEEDKSTPELRAYINSELAVALYVDMTVIEGELEGRKRARAAIRSVLPQITDTALRNNPAKWEKEQEDMLINAIKTQHKRVGRVSLIENIRPALSQNRGAFT